MLNKITVSIFIILFMSSCQNHKINGKDNVVELFYNDYEIINYQEHQLKTMETYENTIQTGIISKTIQINFKLRIINSEKLVVLKKSIYPIIYLNINDKKYLAKGQLNVLSSFPKECDFMFSIDNNGNIDFFEDKIISFLGFENR